MQPSVMLFWTLVTGILGREIGFVGIPIQFPGNEKIVGGEPVKIENHGHQAALLVKELNQDYRLRCGAGVISKRYALSAAHCNIPPHVNAQLFLRVGSSFYDDGGQVIEVDEVFMHPSYVDIFLWNDICVLRTNQDMNHHLVNFIRIDIRTPEDGQILEVNGWGRTNQADPNSISHVLRGVQKTKSSDRNCVSSFWIADMKSQFCAEGNGTTGVSNGDSGSIIYSIEDGKIRAVGLVSGGALSTDRSIYTRLNYIISWIESITDEKVTEEDNVTN